MERKRLKHSCWSLLYSAVLTISALEQTHCAHMWFSISDSLFMVHFWNPPKWCTYSADMAGATWNCCHLSAFCVHHTTTHHVTSCKATYVKPVLNWVNVCSLNILWTLQRTMIRFLIELLVRRIWFGQSKLYFILNWLVMRCKLWPELAADTLQTAWSKM